VTEGGGHRGGLYGGRGRKLPWRGARRSGRCDASRGSRCTSLLPTTAAASSSTFASVRCGLSSTSVASRDAARHARCARATPETASRRGQRSRDRSRAKRAGPVRRRLHGVIAARLDARGTDAPPEPSTPERPHARRHARMRQRVSLVLRSARDATRLRRASSLSNQPPPSPRSETLNLDRAPCNGSACTNGGTCADTCSANAECKS